jgi:hypothetical protein
MAMGFVFLQRNACAYSSVLTFDKMNYPSFEQEFFLEDHQTRVFFDPETIGGRPAYQLLFIVRGYRYKVVLKLGEDGHWRMPERQQNGKWGDQETRFAQAIINRVGTGQ